MKKIGEMTLNEYVKMRKRKLKTLTLKHYEEEMKKLETLGEIILNEECRKAYRKSFKLWISYIKKLGMERTYGEINNSVNDSSYIAGLKYVIDWLGEKSLTIHNHKVVKKGTLLVDEYGL
jgi:hypothetical protein